MYLYQIEQKGTFPPGISPPFFPSSPLFFLSLADSLFSLLKIDELWPGELILYNEVGQSHTNTA